MRCDVRIKNNEEKDIASLSRPASKILSGQVDIDANASVTRSATVTFVDEKGKLRFEAHSPAHGAVFVDRFISIVYEVWLPKYQEWAKIPLFWGPISGYSRNGAEVTVEAMGKERLLQAPHTVFKGYTLKKGTSIHDCIKNIARRQGETRFRIPRLKSKLTRPRGVHRGAVPWKLIAGGKHVSGFTVTKRRGGAKHDKHDKHKKDVERKESPGLIRGVPGNYDAIYNGRGELEAQKLNHKVQHKFKWARDLATRPNLDYDDENFINYVIVYGSAPKGKKQRPEGHACLPVSNPLSPHRLGRNGKPRRMILEVKADHLKTEAQCAKHAKKVLKHHAQEGVDISFDVLPFPMLEENDWIEVETQEYKFKFQVKTITIPLISDQLMSVGYHKKVKPLKHRKKQGGGRAGPGGGQGRGGHGGRHHGNHHRGRHHRGRHRGRHNRGQHHRGKHHGGKHKAGKR